VGAPNVVQLEPVHKTMIVLGQFYREFNKNAKPTSLASS